MLLVANAYWHPYSILNFNVLQLTLHGIEAVLVSLRDFNLRFKEYGNCWRELRMNRASLIPRREGVSLKRLIAPLRREQPDLLHILTLDCAVYGALAARFVMVRALVDALTGLGNAFSSDRLKARRLVVKKICNVHTELVRLPVQIVVALE